MLAAPKESRPQRDEITSRLETAPPFGGLVGTENFEVGFTDGSHLYKSAASHTNLYCAKSTFRGHAVLAAKNCQPVNKFKELRPPHQGVVNC